MSAELRRATGTTSLPGASPRRPPRLLRLPGTYPVQADTELLAEVLARSGLARGRRVLDVGCGGGALAVAAGRAGAGSVTAVDLSLRSVITAWLNGRVNGVRVTVHRGDLLAPLRGERFDLVVANLPYVPSARPAPRHAMGRCWDGGTDGRALLDLLCDQAPQALTPSGALLLVHSALAGEAPTLARLADAGLPATVVARTRVPFGPVMRSRAPLLLARGLIAPGQQEEELVVVVARAPEQGAADAGRGPVDRAA